MKPTSLPTDLPERFSTLLPKPIQAIKSRIIISLKLLLFEIKWTYNRGHPNPKNIYWISPRRITHHLNYVPKEHTETLTFNGDDLHFDDRSLPHDERLRGKTLDGNWDLTNNKFTDLEAYQAIKERIAERKEWKETRFYSSIIRLLDSGQTVWEIKEKQDLDRRCAYLDWLIMNIKTKGYTLNRNNYYGDSDPDEINVDIGRNGDYLFQDGRHRLSIAKVLTVKHVPVMVFVRHRAWQDFREYIISYSKRQPGGRLQQPIVHPDLADIDYDRKADCENIFVAIKHHLRRTSGTMLDTNANLGFFCHRFEDLGYECYAIEEDPDAFRILDKIRLAENKTFKVLNKPIFELESLGKTKFDIVLALDSFEQSARNKQALIELEEVLANLKTSQLFVGISDQNPNKTENTTTGVSSREFIDFLMKHAWLNNSEMIYTAKNGRRIYRLSR